MSEAPIALGLLELSGLMELVPGAVGGLCNVFVGHPMDLIKVRQQSLPASTTTAAAAASRQMAGAAAAAATTTTASPSTYGMVREVFVKEGVTGLYRGITSPLLAVTPAFALTFWSFDIAKTCMLYGQDRRDLTVAESSFAGGFSGIPVALVLGPSERIKCLMQVDKQKYNTFIRSAIMVYGEGGIQSLYKGILLTMMRDVPGNAAYFGTYEISKRTFAEWEGRSKPSTSGVLMAGGLAGVANWLVAIPMDSLKSRFQTAPDGKYAGIIDVFTKTVRNEGFPALFRGLSPALLRAFPANAACLLGVETARSWFGR